MSESRLERWGRNFLMGTYVLAAFAIGHYRLSGKAAEDAKKREDHDAAIGQMYQNIEKYAKSRDMDLYAMEEKQ